MRERDTKPRKERTRKENGRDERRELEAGSREFFCFPFYFIRLCALRQRRFRRQNIVKCPGSKDELRRVEKEVVFIHDMYALNELEALIPNVDADLILVAYIYYYSARLIKMLLRQGANFQVIFSSVVKRFFSSRELLGIYKSYTLAI